MQHILQDLLSADLNLLMDARTRTLSLLNTLSSSIVAQEQLTRNEWTLLVVFAENHPHYAPNELLLASLTSLSPDICRRRIHDAQEKGADAVRKELKPVYRALSTLRKKLKDVYPPLKIFVLREAGYVLRVSPDVGEESLW